MVKCLRFSNRLPQPLIALITARERSRNIRDATWLTVAHPVWQRRWVLPAARRPASKRVLDMRRDLGRQLRRQRDAGYHLDTQQLLAPLVLHAHDVLMQICWRLEPVPWRHGRRRRRERLLSDWLQRSKM